MLRSQIWEFTSEHALLNSNLSFPSQPRKSVWENNMIHSIYLYTCLIIETYKPNIM